MASLRVRTIRQKLNIGDENIPDMFTFEAWKGSAIKFQVGVFNGDTVIDLDTVSSINMRVKDSQTGETTLMDKTVVADNLDLTLTAEDWAAGTDEHCTFEYSNAEANLTMTTPKIQLWVVFTAILTAGGSVTLGGGTFFLHEDNNAASAPPAENLGTAITLEEADARYATAAQGTDERVPTSEGLTSKFSTNKATIVDADKIAIFDSAASDAPKHSLFSLIKSTLKNYFDTFYSTISDLDDEASTRSSADSALGNAIDLKMATTTAESRYVRYDESQSLANDDKMQLKYNSLSATSKGCILGDSTIAAYGGANGIETYLLSVGDAYAGTTVTNNAVAGHTIAQQQAVWTADGNKLLYDWIVIQVGLNDLDWTESASTALARYQTLIDTINATKKDSAIIIIATMTPCRARLITLYGGTNGVTAYNKWVSMNLAISGGAGAITGASYRVVNHTSNLNNGSGNLISVFDQGDGVHENNEGRQIIAGEWFRCLNGLGFLNVTPIVEKYQAFTESSTTTLLKLGKLQIGSGSTTSCGIILGYSGVSGYSNTWSTSVGITSSTNYHISSNGIDTLVNAPLSTGIIYFLAGNSIRGNINGSTGTLTMNAGIIFSPATSATPATNGQLLFERTSNTSLTVKMKGSDGVVRSSIITLA